MASPFRNYTDSDVSEKTGYEKLLQCSDSENDLEPVPLPTRTNRQQSYRRWLVFSGKALAILLVLWSTFCLGAVSFSGKSVGKHVHEHHERLSCNCGSDVAEAIAKGCIFDGIAAAFLPAHCRDDELLAQFNTVGDNPDGTWNYWKDPHMEVRLDEAGIMEAAQAVEPFYASQKWHIVHCTYNWRKQYRAPRTGVVVEKEVDSEGHINHCEAIFQMEQPLTAIRTRSGIGMNADIPRHKGEEESEDRLSY